MSHPHYHVMHLASDIIDQLRIGSIARVESEPKHPYNQPVTTLPFLTIRTLNRLKYDKIKTIGTLLGTPYNYIQTTRNIGKPTAEKLIADLIKWGDENNLPIQSSRLIYTYNNNIEPSKPKRYILPYHVRLNQSVLRGGFTSKLSRILPIRGYKTMSDMLNEKESAFKKIRSVGPTSAKSIRPTLEQWCKINRIDPNGFVFFKK